ncbi:MAG: ATP-binding cassette domain-containing protein [Ignavibacteriales bacterium]|nr:MAG: ATP-binding cassette domain-containing protein [Ignavibacteriales bacterium]
MKTYLRILSYARPYKKFLALSIMFTMLYALLNGLAIYLTIPLLDTLFQESARQAAPAKSNSFLFLPEWVIALKDSVVAMFNDFVFAGTKIDALVRICSLVLSAYLLKNIFGYMQAFFLNYVEQGIMRDLRNDAYNKLHNLPLSYFKNEKTGNLISRIINDTNVVQASVSAAFLNAIREPITIIVFLGMAFSISWQLTLLAFIILPFTMGIIAAIGLKLRKQSNKIQQKVADLTSLIQETITGVKIVKAFTMEKYEKEKFGSEAQKFFRLMLKITRTRNLSSPITEVLSMIVGVVIIYYGGRLVLVDQSLKASEFLGFLFAIFQLMPPIKELSSVNNRIQESSAAGDRVFEIIDAEPEPAEKEGTAQLTGLNESIEVRDLSFKYDPDGEYILSGISFTVKKGEIIALVGPSGGGKSTLVDLIPRFYDPTSGGIYIDGRDIRTLSLKSLRGRMGIVTQETILFNESIRDNIAYGLKDYPFEQIEDAARMANAHSFITELPEGYNTIVGERGVKLSGGQRQRISIARALLKNPEIMIFDEATSALDNESELLVQEAIERLMKNRTVFVIAHRLSTIRNASRIFLIEKGKIIQSGTHDELMENPSGLYRRLYEMQFKEET